LNQSQILFARKARVGQHDQLPTPGGLGEAAQHLAKEDVLMPFDRVASVRRREITT
jgi:hypothetical protein